MLPEEFDPARKKVLIVQGFIAEHGAPQTEAEHEKHRADHPGSPGFQQAAVLQQQEGADPLDHQDQHHREGRGCKAKGGGRREDGNSHRAYLKKENGRSRAPARGFFSENAKKRFLNKKSLTNAKRRC